jgi:hypothetical protein
MIIEKCLKAMAITHFFIFLLLLSMETQFGSKCLTAGLLVWQVYKKVVKYGCSVQMLFINTPSLSPEKPNDLLKVEKRNSFGTL